MSLHVFEGEYECVIAHSVDDVRRYFVDDEQLIENEEFEPETWAQLPDDRDFTVTYWEAERPERLPDGAVIIRITSEHNPENPAQLRVTATCAAWAASQGRGTFASTEW